VDPATIVLLTFLGSLVLLLSDVLRYDIVALLVVLALVLSGALEPREAFAGFASEAVLVIACMGVFGHTLTRWGVAEAVCQRLFTRGERSEAMLVLRLSTVAALFAAFMTDAAVVGVLIPIAHALSRKRGIPLSRLLLPVSFGCFLGDLLLVVGSAKNIALNGALEHLGAEPFGMFDFTHFGALILVIGVLYLAGPGRRLLPSGPLPESLSQQYKIPKFVTEVLIEPTSDLIRKYVSDLRWHRDYNVTLLGIVRGQGEGTLLAPGPYTRVAPRDLLIVQGEPDAVLRLQRELGLHVSGSAKVGDTLLVSDDVQLVEAVVPAGSDFAGRTLAEADFRARTGLHVLAISKHGEVHVKRIGRQEIDVGDTLLIQGHQRDIERARRERELLVLGQVELTRIGRRAYVTVALLAALFLLAGLRILPLDVAALAGAAGLVLARCIPAREIYGSIDWVVIVLIGGMLALGRAFDKYELGSALASRVAEMSVFAGNPQLVLVALMLLAVALAQAATSVGTAVLLAPVALSLASALGVSDRAFLMAVLTGTNCAFLSPVANAANAMVVGPGGYRFRDFLRAGFPLTMLIVVLAAFVLPILWPFQP
jgi:di/tricarboxylate transporter